MTKYTCCILVAVFIARGPLYSQNQHAIDSLTEVIEKSQGVEKYTAWHKLVVEYINVDAEKALALMDKAEAVALSTLDSTSILKSKRLRGQILYRLGKPHAAILLMEPLVSNSYLQKVSEEYLAVTNLLGISHLLISQFDRGLEYLFLCNQRARHDHNDYYTAVSASNIGVAYYKLKDYAKALPFMISGYQKEDSLGIMKFGTLVNISLCYSNLREYDHAVRFLQRSITLCGDECDSQGLTHIKYASGYIFYGLKRYDKAESEFLASLEFSKQANDHRMQLDNIYLLARISIERNDLRNAEYYLTAGDRLIDKEVPFNLEAIKVYSELSELYLRLRNFEQASFYQSRYIALRDSIYNESLMTNLMKIESGYMQRENEAKIAAQSEALALKQAVIEKQKLVNVLTVALTMMFACIVVMLLKSLQKKSRWNKALEQKVAERTVELHTQLASLTESLSHHKVKVARAVNNIKQSLATIGGLGVVISEDVNRLSFCGYAKKVVDQSSRIRESLCALAGDEE